MPTQPTTSYDEEHLADYDRLNNQWFTPADKSIFPRTPLAKILVYERRWIVSRKMDDLERLTEIMLSAEKEAFLLSLVGKDWGRRFYFPTLATAIDAEEYMSEIYPTLNEKVGILMNAMNGTRRLTRALYLASLPYFFTTEAETIEIYKGVLNEGKKFPREFFVHDEGRKAGIVVRHMHEKLKGLKPSEVFSRASRRDFEKYGLTELLVYHFSGLVINAVENAYPKVDYPSLYKDDKPVTGLGHLVDSLDSLFGK